MAGHFSIGAACTELEHHPETTKIAVDCHARDLKSGATQKFADLLEHSNITELSIELDEKVATAFNHHDRETVGDVLAVLLPAIEKSKVKSLTVKDVSYDNWGTNDHDIEAILGLPVEYLCLTSSKLRDKGLLDSGNTARIAEGLSGNYTLRTLDISNNKIGRSGGMNIARGLANTHVTRVFMDGNPITSDAEYAIKKAVEKNVETMRQREKAKEDATRKAQEAEKAAQQKAERDKRVEKEAALNTELSIVRKSILLLLKPEASAHIGERPATIRDRLELAQIQSAKLVKGFDDRLDDIIKEINDIAKTRATLLEELGLAEAEQGDAAERNSALGDEIANVQIELQHGSTAIKSMGEVFVRAKQRVSQKSLVRLSGVAIESANPVALMGNLIGFSINRSQIRLVAEIEKLKAIQQQRMLWDKNDLLEARKVDIEALDYRTEQVARQLKEFAESEEIRSDQRADVGMERLKYGLLIAQLVEQGLSNVKDIEDFRLDGTGFSSVDELLESIKEKDARLYQALSHFVLGRANTADINVIIEESNAVDMNASPTDVQKVLHNLVEGAIKHRPESFLNRASRMDIISELQLLDDQEIGLDKHDGRPGASHAKNIEVETRVAMMGMFADQTGVSHIGNYDVRRLFSFYLHRHGNHALHDTLVEDGRVNYTGQGTAPKKVSVMTAGEADVFREQFERSYQFSSEEPPRTSDLFLRVCAYEYYLPQSVRAGMPGNDFAENPEAPIGIVVTNQVINDFIQRMVEGGIDNYNQVVGDKMNALIAQTFIDFFAKAGQEHKILFRDEREQFRKSHRLSNAVSGSARLEELVLKDMRGRFDQFLEIYKHNLEKTLQILPKDQASILEAEIQKAAHLADGQLNPEVVKPGTPDAIIRARGDADGQKLTNMIDRVIPSGDGKEVDLTQIRY